MSFLFQNPSNSPASTYCVIMSFLQLGRCNCDAECCRAVVRREQTAVVTAAIAKTALTPVHSPACTEFQFTVTANNFLIVCCH